MSSAFRSLRARLDARLDALRLPRGVPSPRAERLALAVPALGLLAMLGARAPVEATAVRVLAAAPVAGAPPAGGAPAAGDASRPAAGTRRVLRVCADPNNLPFSNRKGEGLENRLAQLIARDLGASVEYTWWAQRRGFVRNTLRAGTCDVIPGIPGSYDLVLATRPYYRSTYVFVARADRKLRPTSLDDPVLRRLTIGITLVGDEGGNAPPAHALAKRGMVDNVRGYSIYGDYRQPNPPARIIDAVVAGEVDLAVVWGPLAGYFAKRSRTPLELTPVRPQIDLPFLPFVFDIAVGVRHGEHALRDEIDGVLVRRRAEIARLLEEFGVPLVGAPGARPGPPHTTPARPRAGG